MPPITSRLVVSVRLAIVGLLISQPITPAVIIVDGVCTLGDAITAANNDAPTGGCPAGSGADEIQLTADVVLLAPLPALAGEVTVEGNGFAVSRDAAAPDFSVLHLISPAPVALQNLTVSNGSASEGGGIFSEVSGPVTLSNTSILDNEALGNGGGIAAYGASLTITNSTIEGNNAGGRGGGIYAPYTTLVASTVRGNEAGSSGGGIYGGWYASVNLVDSVLSGNIAGTNGGGVDAGTQYGSATLVNSTVTGNVAAGIGGGLFISGYSNSASLVNSTITGNSAATAGGLYVYGEFGLTAGAGERFVPEGHYANLTLRDNIIADNSGGDCLLLGIDFSPDVSGNFDGDDSCFDALPIVAGVDFETSAANNGGSTVTHALLAGSVAIDAAGACGLSTDQRGFPRDSACDAGAYEFVDFSLAVTGRCPGLVTIDVTTSSPNQGLIVFAGTGAGSSTVPGAGACSGTALDIDSARRWRTLMTDATGQVSTSLTLGSQWCDRVVQAVDRDCATSNTADIP